MTATSAVTSEDGHEERLREAVTMAFYVAICLLAALSAVQDDADAGHVEVLRLVWGTTVGLALAHWFAFRLSARLVGRAEHAERHAGVALAQIGGAVAVAVLATVPILLLPSTAELDVVRVEMALLLAVGGYAVARTEGAPRGRSVAYAAGVFVLAVAVALVKNRLGHH